MIKINYAELIRILDMTPAQQSILIAGKHGIGKSDIITEHYRKKGYEIVTLFLGQMSDAGDLLGLPRESQGTDSSPVMTFLPPFWWQHEKPFLLFLDEINRARPEILQVIFDLVLNRKLGGRSLPDGSMVVAACNYGDQYQLTELDPALVSRFNIYELDPEHTEWLKWATAAGIDKRILTFHTKNLAFLDPSTEQKADSMDKTPDRRAWVRVSGILENAGEHLEEFHYKAIAGIVGPGAAGLFKRHIETKVEISPEELLFSENGETVSQSLAKLPEHDIIYFNKQLITYISMKHEVFNADSHKLELIQNNFLVYINTLLNAKYNEILGELSNSIMNNADVAAILLIKQEIVSVFKKLIANTRVV